VDSRSGDKTQKHPSESLLENMAFYYNKHKVNNTTSFVYINIKRTTTFL